MTTLTPQTCQRFRSPSSLSLNHLVSAMLSALALLGMQTAQADVTNMYPSMEATVTDDTSWLPLAPEQVAGKISDVFVQAMKKQALVPEPFSTLPSANLWLLSKDHTFQLTENRPLLAMTLHPAWNAHTPVNVTLNNASDDYTSLKEITAVGEEGAKTHVHLNGMLRLGRLTVEQGEVVSTTPTRTIDTSYEVGEPPDRANISATQTANQIDALLIGQGANVTLKSALLGYVHVGQGGQLVLEDGGAFGLQPVQYGDWYYPEMSGAWLIEGTAQVEQLVANTLRLKGTAEHQASFEQISRATEHSDHSLAINHIEADHAVLTLQKVWPRTSLSLTNSSAVIGSGYHGHLTLAHSTVTLLDLPYLEGDNNYDHTIDRLELDATSVLQLAAPQDSSLNQVFVRTGTDARSEITITPDTSHWEVPTGTSLLLAGKVTINGNSPGNIAGEVGAWDLTQSGDNAEWPSLFVGASATINGTLRVANTFTARPGSLPNGIFLPIDITVKETGKLDVSQSQLKATTIINQSRHPVTLGTSNFSSTHISRVATMGVTLRDGPFQIDHLTSSVDPYRNDRQGWGAFGYQLQDATLTIQQATIQQATSQPDMGRPLTIATLMGNSSLTIQTYQAPSGVFDGPYFVAINDREKPRTSTSKTVEIRELIENSKAPYIELQNSYLTSDDISLPNPNTTSPSANDLLVKVEGGGWYVHTANQFTSFVVNKGGYLDWRSAKPLITGVGGTVKAGGTVIVNEQDLLRDDSDAQNLWYDYTVNHRSDEARLWLKNVDHSRLGSFATMAKNDTVYNSSPISYNRMNYLYDYDEEVVFEATTSGGRRPTAVYGSMGFFGTLKAPLSQDALTLSRWSSVSTVRDLAYNGSLGFAKTTFEDLTVEENRTLSIFGVTTDIDSTYLVGGASGSVTMKEGMLRLGIVQPRDGENHSRRGGKINTVSFEPDAYPSDLQNVGGLDGESVGIYEGERTTVEVLVEGGKFSVDHWKPGLYISQHDRALTGRWNWRQSGLKALSLYSGAELILNLDGESESKPLGDMTLIGPQAKLTLNVNNQNNSQVWLGNYLEFDRNSHFALVGQSGKTKVNWTEMHIGEGASVMLDGVFVPVIATVDRDPDNYRTINKILPQDFPARTRLINRGAFTLTNASAEASLVLDDWFQYGSGATTRVDSAEVESLLLAGGTVTVNRTLSQRRTMEEDLGAPDGLWIGPRATLNVGEVTHGKRLVNMGTVNVTQNLNLDATDAEFTNYGTLTVGSSLVVGGIFRNYGTVSFTGQEGRLQLETLDRWGPNEHYANLKVLQIGDVQRTDNIIDAYDVQLNNEAYESIEVPKLEIYGQRLGHTLSRKQFVTPDLTWYLAHGERIDEAHRGQEFFTGLIHDDFVVDKMTLGAYNVQNPRDVTASDQQDGVPVTDQASAQSINGRDRVDKHYGEVIVTGSLRIKQPELTTAEGRVLTATDHGVIGISETGSYDFDRGERGNATLLIGSRFQIASGSSLELRNTPEKPEWLQVRYNQLGPSLWAIEDRNAVGLRAENRSLTVLNGALVKEDSRAVITGFATALSDEASSSETTESEPTARRVRMVRSVMPDSPKVWIGPGARLQITDLDKVKHRVVILQDFLPADGMVENHQWMGGWSGSDALLTSERGLPLLANTYWEQTNAETGLGNLVIDVQGEDITPVAEAEALLSVRAEMLSTTNRFNERVNTRMVLPPVSTGLWAIAEGGRYEERGVLVDGKRGGYRENSGGITVGGDRFVRDDLLAGLAFSYVNGTTHYAGEGLPASGRIEAYALQGYGVWHPAERVRILGSLGAYKGHADLTITLPKAGNEATTDIRMRGYWANARAEVDFNLAHLIWTPHVGARFVHLSDADFRTDINGEKAFDSHEDATRTWQFPLGVTVHKSWVTTSGWTHEPRFDVTVTRQRGERNTQLTTYNTPTGLVSTVPVVFAGGYFVETSLGWKAERDLWRFSGGYTWGSGRLGRNDHRVNLEMSYRW